MTELKKLWSIASLSIEGVDTPADLDEHDGLEGLMVAYVNNVSNILGIKQMFTGNILESGEFEGRATNDLEPSTLTLFMRHFASKGNILDGKLDMSEAVGEWVSSLPYLVEEGKLNVSSNEDNFVLSMIAKQLSLGDFEPEHALLGMPIQVNDNASVVAP